MAERTVIEKIGVKQNVRALLMDAPESVSELFSGLATEQKLSGEFDYIHLFVKDEAGFVRQFPIAKKHLKSTGMLWVSWPKSGKLQSPLSLTKIIKLGYDFSMVESKVISLDTTWSAIKFTFPKVGKTYSNSFGTLPDAT